MEGCGTPWCPAGYSFVDCGGTLEADYLTYRMQEEQPAEEDTSQRQGFEWTRQWYPVAVMRDLEAMDRRKPYPVQVRLPL